MNKTIINHLVNAETAILKTQEKKKYNAHNTEVMLTEVQYAISLLRNEKSKDEKIKESDIDAANRAFTCAHCAGGYCSVIKHPIENGYASLCHCRTCEKYEKKDEY